MSENWKPFDPDGAAKADKALQHATALTIECPDCGAAPGVDCVNQWTGEPLVKLPAHLHRLLAVGQ